MPNPPPAVASWHDQIERLSEHDSPCRYLLTPAMWAAIRANALAFIDQHGAEAYRLGWTAEQLFGVHPEHGFLRVEYAGALRSTTAGSSASSRTGSCSTASPATGQSRGRPGGRRSGSSRRGAADVWISVAAYRSSARARVRYSLGVKPCRALKRRQKCA